MRRLAVSIVLKDASHVFWFGYERPMLVNLLDEGVNVPTDVISSRNGCWGARVDTAKASTDPKDRKRSIAKLQDVVRPRDHLQRRSLSKHRQVHPPLVWLLDCLL